MSTEDGGQHHVDPASPVKRTAALAARGTLYIGLAQAITAALSIVSTIFVARLLTPQDYGVLAMVTPITGFILIFQSLGLNQALVQSRSLSHIQVDTLFWINLGAAMVISVTMLALSPLIAWFYDDPRSGNLTAAFAIVAIVSGAAMQHTALLSRQLRFATIAMVDVSRAIVTFLVTLASAYVLRNYWALWLGLVAGALCNVVLAWIVNGWRPRMRFDYAATKPMVNFGANLTGFTILNFLTRNMDNLLIAKYWGAAAVGLYDRSYKLMMFPLQNVNAPLGRVMLPLLGRLSAEPQRYRRAFLGVARAISLITIPGIMVAAATSGWLVPFLLGPKWTEASSIFFWLSIAAITQPISNCAGWLFTTTGRTAALFKWGVFASALTIPAFLIGLPWGPAGVACAYAIVQVVLALVLYRLCTIGTLIRYADFLWIMLPSLVGGGLAWMLSPWIARSLSSPAALLALLGISYCASTLLHLISGEGRQSAHAALGTIRNRKDTR